MLSRFIRIISNRGYKIVTSLNNSIRYSSRVEDWFMSQGLLMFIELNNDFDARIFNFITYVLGLKRCNTDSPCNLGFVVKYKDNREFMHQFKNFSLRSEFNRKDNKSMFDKVRL